MYSVYEAPNTSTLMRGLTTSWTHVPIMQIEKWYKRFQV